MNADITQLLISAQSGDDDARAEVYRNLYQDLRQRARAQLRRRPAATFSTTALVNESYLRLFDASRLNVENRNHFLALSVQAMRRILVDHYRGKIALKRGSGQALLTLHPDKLSDNQRGALLVQIDDALEQLAQLNPRLSQVVQYKFFLGLTEQEIAEALDLTTRTVRSDWRKARAWLAHELANS